MPALTTSQMMYKMHSRIPLDVAVTQRAAVVEHLTHKDKAHLMCRGTSLVLIALLEAFNRVSWLNVKYQRVARESLHTHVHANLCVSS